jgi:Ni,Fe-hydrogenase I small subunit
MKKLLAVALLVLVVGCRDIPTRDDYWSSRIPGDTVFYRTAGFACWGIVQKNFPQNRAMIIGHHNLFNADLVESRAFMYEDLEKR